MSLETKRFCGACGKAEEKVIKESRNEDLGELKNLRVLPQVLSKKIN
jgi:hypothetical protein